MKQITEDKSGNPIGIGTVVRVDESVMVPTKIGSVVEVSFKRDSNTNEEVTLLKIAGVRSEVKNVNVDCVDLTEFETVLFNELSRHKAYLTEDGIHLLANKLVELARHE